MTRTCWDRLLPRLTSLNEPKSATVQRLFSLCQMKQAHKPGLGGRGRHALTKTAKHFTLVTVRQLLQRPAATHNQKWYHAHKCGIEFELQHWSSNTPLIMGTLSESAWTSAQSKQTQQTCWNTSDDFISSDFYHIPGLKHGKTLLFL